MLTYAGPRALVVIGLLVAVTGVALALIVPPEGELSLVHLMAPFLFGFGAFKGAVAIDALLQRRRNPAAAERLLAHHGSDRALKTWIAYKFAAMLMAFIAALICLIRIL
jgi:hypothetical protein